MKSNVSFYVKNKDGKRVKVNFYTRIPHEKRTNQLKVKRKNKA